MELSSYVNTRQMWPTPQWTKESKSIFMRFLKRVAVAIKMSYLSLVLCQYPEFSKPLLRMRSPLSFRQNTLPTAWIGCKRRRQRHLSTLLSQFWQKLKYLIQSVDESWFFNSLWELRRWSCIFGQRIILARPQLHRLCHGQAVAPY